MAFKKGFTPPKSISWKDAIRTVEVLGAVFVRQAKGHRHYELLDKSGVTHLIDIPKNNDIDGDLLRSIIRQTGVSKDEFWKAFKK
ncbi:MAG: type II toxin-antitoxin system HicA family toxin [Bacillota bacterium]